MARLNFDLAEVAREVEAVKAASAHRPLYDEATGPGLWLVGDHGVYLMGNHERPPLPEGEAYPLAFAKECNPITCDFDDWWETKRATFGGDDGVEFLPLAMVETWLAQAEKVSINFTRDSYALETVRARLSA